MGMGCLPGEIETLIESDIYFEFQRGKIPIKARYGEVGIAARLLAVLFQSE